MGCDHLPEGFCRVCHCRKITLQREGAAGYRERHQAGLDRWANARAAGLGIRSADRPVVRFLTQKKYPVEQARAMVRRWSQPTPDQGEGQ